MARLRPDHKLQDEQPDLKVKLDRLHFSKIDLADRVHVISVNGYFGESTRNEMKYAQSLGKHITFMSDAEVKAAYPILL